MSKVVRSVKNVTKGYSSVQVKVRNGTCDLCSGLRVLASLAIAALFLATASLPASVVIQEDLLTVLAMQQRATILGARRALTCLKLRP